MAVKRTDVNGYISLTATETVIGVILNREIQNNVKVRPTNVTAGISTTPHVRVGAVQGNFSFTYPAIGTPITVVGTIRVDNVDLDGIEVGNIVTFNGNGFTFSGATGFPIEGVVTSVTGGVLVAEIRRNTTTHTFSVTVTIGDNESITVLAPNGSDPIDFILLHNGPKGGFKQNFRPEIAGSYRVNTVVGGVVTE